MMMNVKHTRYGRCCQYTSSNETLVGKKKKKIMCQGFIFLIETNLQSVSKKVFFSLHLVQKKRHLYPLVLCFKIL